MFALTTNHSTHVRCSFVDAGVLFVMLAMIRDVRYPWAPSIVLDIEHGEIIPLSLVNSAASTLLQFIRQHGIGFSDDIPNKWKDNWFRAVEIFLGDGDVVEDVYQECETLFRELLM
jgi:hypothetical protein